VLYILKSGRLAQETVVYIEEQNKYPTVSSLFSPLLSYLLQGLSKWELQTTKRKVQFELRKIRENEIFGH